MKYEVELTRTQSQTFEVFAESPEEAAKMAEEIYQSFRGIIFSSRSVTEIANDGYGDVFDVNGKCESCNVHLIDDNFHVDSEGYLFCEKCFQQLLDHAKIEGNE